MFVVVVGSRDWNNEPAVEQVRKLLYELREKYPGLVLVTSSTDKGVGKIVRDVCMESKSQFELCDLHMKVHAQLNRPKLAQVFYARNAALAELGEEYHIFVDKNRRGSFEDLVDKLEKSSSPKPLFLHLPEGF